MQKIPLHIKEIGKVYPPIKSTNDNLADGRIENWANSISKKYDLPKPGSYITLYSQATIHLETIYLEEIWVYLGSYYFKQVIKKVRS